MRALLRNPYFVAIAIAAVVGTASALMIAPYTEHAGEAVVVGAAAMCNALVPTLLVAYLVTVVMRENARLREEQASEPQYVIQKRYKEQMTSSIATALLGSILIAVIAYIGIKDWGGAFLVSTPVIVFGLFSFLRALCGWFRNQ